ncbi:MAG: hypothetical protein M3P98_03290 [bacterium]|nr:hypothetical protein [bacterium]
MNDNQDDINTNIKELPHDGSFNEDDIASEVEKEQQEAGFDGLKDEEQTESKFVEDGLVLENDPTEPTKPVDEPVKKPMIMDQPIIDHNDGIRDKIENFFHKIWRDKKYRYEAIAVPLLFLILIFAIPQIRYFALNAVGVRTQASMIVYDQSTNQPLKNVEVNIGGKIATTNEDGYAGFEDLKLGLTAFSFKRKAFADMEMKHTLGWGDNKMGNVDLSPTGLQYKFLITDFLGEQPIPKAEAVNGELSAFSNEKGELTVTTDKTDETEGSGVFTIKTEGYRDKEVEATDVEQEVKLVPSKKHVYASNRSGNLDVYSTYADGEDDHIVLKATGSEVDDMAISTHPTQDISAVVSTRNNQRNSDGYLLSTLTILDLNKANSKEIDVSENIVLIGWTNDDLVYVKTKSGASENNPDRQKIVAYNVESKEVTELATSNYFNDVAIAKGRVYYAPSSAFQQGVDVSLFAINPDGTNKQVVFLQEVWRLIRSSLDNFTIAVGQAWYDYEIGSQNEPSVLNGAPTKTDSISYVPDSSGSRYLFSDIRDEKGVLIWLNKESGEQNVIISEKGLTKPYYWLNSTNAVYRVSNNQESADYVVNISNNKALKITDVTNTNSLDNWYRY